MQPSTSTKKARRRVADDIQVQPSERVKSLLAVLERAQKGEKVDKKDYASKETSKSTKTQNSELPSKKNKKVKSTVATAVERSAAKMKASRVKVSSVGARMSRSKQVQYQNVTNDSNRRSRNQSTSVQVYTNKNYQQQGGKSNSIAVERKIPQDVVDDIHFRFLANIPDTEKRDNIRICFQVELAQWFYVDFYCKTSERKDCPNLGMREFARQIFSFCPEFKHVAHKGDYMIDQWRQYKSSVPTYGAILLDESLNNVLLVQGYYASKNKWGFPKGKVNENEEPRTCAIREVLEETGFDFSEVSSGNEYKIQKFVNDTMIRLYIATNVPMDFPFSPQTRCEIRKIQWFNVWDLPTDRFDPNHKSTSNFYAVIPFVQDLHNYIRKEQAKRVKEKSKAQHSDNYFNEITPGTQMQPMPSNFSQSEQQFSSVSLNALFNNLLPHSKAPGPPAPPAKGLNVGDNFKSLSNLFSPSAGGHPLLSTQSHFRPVENGPAHAGSSIIDMLQTGAPKFGSPQIAQPIPVQAKPQPTPPIKTSNENVKERKSNKIRLSETSAFTAIQPKKSIASNASTVSSVSNITRQHTVPPAPQLAAPSIEEMELELQRLLIAPNPKQDMTNETDIPSANTPARDSDVNSIYNSTLELHNIPYYGEVQLCHAWKRFRLNVSEIFPKYSGVYGKS